MTGVFYSNAGVEGVSVEDLDVGSRFQTKDFFPKKMTVTEFRNGELRTISKVPVSGEIREHYGFYHQLNGGEVCMHPEGFILYEPSRAGHALLKSRLENENQKN